MSPLRPAALVTVLALAVTLDAARGQAPPQKPVTATPSPVAAKSPAADGPRAEAQAARKQAGDVLLRAAKASPLLKEAYQAFALAKQDEARALDALVRALENGDPGQVKAAREAREKARQPVALAQERQSAREAQQRNTLDTNQVERLTKSTPAALRTKLDALLAARQAAASAWDAVARAAYAGGDVSTAKLKAVEAEGAARVVDRDHEFSCEIARAAEEGARTGADLAKPLEQASTLLQQAIDLEKKRAEVDRGAMKLDFDRRQLRAEIRSRLDAARLEGEKTKKVEKWLSDSW